MEIGTPIYWKIDEWVANAARLLAREDIKPIRYSIAAASLDEAIAEQYHLLAAGLPEVWVLEVMAHCSILRDTLVSAAAESLPKSVLTDLGWFTTQSLHQ
jgi:hypothetical protein